MIAFQDFCYMPNTTSHVIVVAVQQDYWRDEPLDPKNRSRNDSVFLKFSCFGPKGQQFK